jgi:methionyl aminopeptidase
MEKEILDKYKKAGEIAAKVLKFGKEMIKPGLKLIDLAEAIDKKIFELKGEPAFPVNISVNEMAAHWTPQLNDNDIIQENDYVKIDVGVHIDGYIGDTALTVRLAGRDELIECSEKMLKTGLALFKPGITIGEIGEAIENVCKKFGFNSVRNLTGHSLGEYDLHAGMLIPNIKNNSKYQLREEEVYAVEPFCTSGNGFVKDSEPTLIFRWINDHPVRILEARKVLELSKTKYNRLPFAKRWIQKQFSVLKAEMSLKELIKVNALYGYSPLKETSGKPVAQSEHTVVVSENPVITTKI